MEEGGGPSKYLSGLPSRGLFSSSVLSSNPGEMRVYVCDHDTAPPAKQQISTNPSNILIQTLQRRKQKIEMKHLKHKDVAGSSKTKRFQLLTPIISMFLVAIIVCIECCGRMTLTPKERDLLSGCQPFVTCRSQLKCSLFD